MKTLSLLLISLVLSGCGNSISLFDPHSYTETISLKVDALNLIDKADTPDTLYRAEIEQLSIRMQKLYEYEKLRPDNTISAQMWSIMKDPDRHMLGGFLRRWQQEKILKRVFIDNAKKLISKGFDLIAELESGKIRFESISDFEVSR